MKCIDPKFKKLVSLYQYNLLPEEEKNRVEAHLLECDACFQEAYQLAPAIETMQTMPDCFTDALQVQPTPSIRLAHVIQKMSILIKKEISAIGTTAHELWKGRAVRIFFPVAIVAIIVFFVFYFPGSPPNSHFSINDNASNLSIKLRGVVDDFKTTDALLDQGIKNFEEQRYEKAIASLKTYVQRKKTDPYGYFYLGVSYVVTDNYKKGIDHLKTARSLCQKQGKELLSEKCCWYLGTAYFKTNDLENALSEFYRVAEIGGDFAEQAKAEIAAIHQQKEN